MVKSRGFNCHNTNTGKSCAKQYFIQIKLIVESTLPLDQPDLS